MHLKGVRLQHFVTSIMEHPGIQIRKINDKPENLFQTMTSLKVSLKVLNLEKEDLRGQKLSKLIDEVMI